MGGNNWRHRMTSGDDASKVGPTSGRRRSRVLVGMVALAIASAVSIQLLPLPSRGPAKAGAAITPLPTSSKPDGGRVPPAKNGGFEAGPVKYGLPKAGTTRVGCWGANYVGVAYAPGGGTWAVNASGGVYADGTAPFYGSLGTCPYNQSCTNQPVDSIAATQDNKGYWLATGGGGVFAFGDARYTPANPLAPGHTGAIVAVVADNGVTNGYWLVSVLGQVYSYGNAGYYGGSPSTLPAAYDWVGDSVVDMVSTPGPRLLDGDQLRHSLPLRRRPNGGLQPPRDRYLTV